MNFLKEASSKFLDSDAKVETEHKKEETTEHKKDEQRSTSELLSSAKVVADATKAKMNKQEYDEGKAAEAAADVLDGAQHYAKLDETQGFGKMIEQAEDYLHKHSSTKTGTAHGADATPPAATTTPHETSGGDYVKMAEGLLNKDDGKKSEEGEEKSGGGLMKMAGSFLK